MWPFTRKNITLIRNKRRDRLLKKAMSLGYLEAKWEFDEVRRGDKVLRITRVQLVD